MDNPYIPIDEAYHAEIEAAIADHETGVTAANAQLASDLDGVEDPHERAAIVADFDAHIAPVRDAFENARAAAEETRESAKAAAKKDYDAYNEEITAAAAAEDMKA